MTKRRVDTTLRKEDLIFHKELDEHIFAVREFLDDVEVFSWHNRAYMIAEPEDLGEELLGAIEKMEDRSTFTSTLLRYIDEKGMTDPECYKRANVSRKLFSKIRSDNKYHPKRTTVFAFVIALRLDLEEAEILLGSAGYAFARNNVMDIIVEFFISKGIYDIDIINQYLYSYGQSLLGF